jgi:hypothetical protein
VLPESVVETAPESFILFSFDDGEDILFGGFIGSVLRRFEAVLQVLPPVTLPMLPKVVTLLLTDRHAKFDVIDGVKPTAFLLRMFHVRLPFLVKFVQRPSDLSWGSAR